jgi:hypothetical protein
VVKTLFKELTDTLDKSYPLEELTVSGVQMEPIAPVLAQMNVPAVRQHWRTPRHLTLRPSSL